MLQDVTVGQDGDTAQAWFQKALGVRCSLVRQQPGSRQSISSAVIDAASTSGQYIGMCAVPCCLEVYRSACSLLKIDQTECWRIRRVRGWCWEEKGTMRTGHSANILMQCRYMSWVSQMSSSFTLTSQVVYCTQAFWINLQERVSYVSVISMQVLPMKGSSCS